MRYVAIVLAAVLAGPSFAAQAPTELRFDAATIKPVSQVTGRLPTGIGLFSRNYITLHNLLIYAYDLPAYRIVGGPGWVTADHFDVLAKTAARPTQQQMREMLQHLLAERFRLTIHREQRELPTFDLVMARADRRPGPNLKPAEVDCTPFLTGKRPMSESPTIVTNGLERPRCNGGLSVGEGLITPSLYGVPVAKLTDHLERTLNRAIIDKTGLTGLFDFGLSYTDDSIPAAFRGDNHRRVQERRRRWWSSSV